MFHVKRLCQGCGAKIEKNNHCKEIKQLSWQRNGISKNKTFK